MYNHVSRKQSQTHFSERKIRVAYLTKRKIIFDRGNYKSNDTINLQIKRIT